MWRDVPKTVLVACAIFGAEFALNAVVSVVSLIASLARGSLTVPNTAVGLISVVFVLAILSIPGLIAWRILRRSRTAAAWASVYVAVQIGGSVALAPRSPQDDVLLPALQLAVLVTATVLLWLPASRRYAKPRPTPEPPSPMPSLARGAPAPMDVEPAGRPALPPLFVILAAVLLGLVAAQCLAIALLASYGSGLGWLPSFALTIAFAVAAALLAWRALVRSAWAAPLTILLAAALALGSFSASHTAAPAAVLAIGASVFLFLPSSRRYWR